MDTHRGRGSYRLFKALPQGFFVLRVLWSEVL
jgi:hypothetical protein